MNNERRGRLREIKTKLDDLYEQIESVKDDEEYAFDNMPENLQYSMRGEESQDAVDALDEALEKLEEVTDLLEGVI